MSTWASWSRRNCYPSCHFNRNRRVYPTYICGMNACVPSTTQCRKRVWVHSVSCTMPILSCAWGGFLSITIRHVYGIDSHTSQQLSHFKPCLRIENIVHFLQNPYDAHDSLPAEPLPSQASGCWNNLGFQVWKGIHLGHSYTCTAQCFASSRLS